MSSRVYPLYQRGNPQLRVFLPNFWMKLVKPKEEIPPNMVHFHVSEEMTTYDVKNYLEKIYNVPVVNVEVEMKNGNVRRSIKQYIIKDDDYKVAYVTLPRNQKFTFPEIQTKPDLSGIDTAKKERAKQFAKMAAQRRLRPGLPDWFLQ